MIRFQYFTISPSDPEIAIFLYRLFDNDGWRLGAGFVAIYLATCTWP